MQHKLSGLLSQLKNFEAPPSVPGSYWRRGCQRQGRFVVCRTDFKSQQSRRFPPKTQGKYFSSTKINGHLSPASKFGTKSSTSSSSVLCSAKSGEADCPDSMDEAIQQAVSSLTAAVESSMSLRQLGKRKRKSKAVQGTSRRFAVEMPLSDSSPASTVELARSIAAGVLQSRELDGLTIVFADFEAAKAALKAAFPAGVDVEFLEEAAGARMSGSLMVVQPVESEIGLVEELLANWTGGGVCVLLNPGREPFSLPEQHRGFLESFETVYGFLPIAMQVFLSRIEGVVFRRFTRGEDAPWQIFQRQGDGFIAIGQQRQRPTRDNVELAFVNAAKFSNPLSKLFSK